MKTWKILTALVLAAISVTLITGSAFAFFGPRAPNTYGTYTNGMMNGYGYNNNNANPSIQSTPQATIPPQTTAPPQINTQTPTPPNPQTTVPNQPSAPGAAPPTYQTPGSGGWGCWGQGGRWGWGTTAPATSAPLTIDSAVQIAKNYITSLNNPDLTVTEVEEYALNFYVQVREKSTGKGAFELLIDKYSGRITPEMGPDMMWNTAYGVRNGLCGWFLGTPTVAPTVTAEQAQANAQKYLNTYYPGTTTGEITVFNGYYHFDVLNSGAKYGMLSVNAYTGQVWFHTWHGAFVQEWTS